MDYIQPVLLCCVVGCGSAGPGRCVWPRCGQSVTCIPTKMAGWVKVVKLERPGGTGIYGFSVIGGPGTEVPLCIGAVIEGSPADYSRQVGKQREPGPETLPAPPRALLGVCGAADVHKLPSPRQGERVARRLIVSHLVV
ncbi:Hypp7840 [Branchiostoma lanceolatum]|uniref:Hypp7840 protein n=1 Tax=Branchiostoma lanceolatum TaxID=7740 RepID=A0A8J9Z4Z3_BRALA|nr:Hypp7840 [Branchiostoma lanceolatum]